MYEELTSYEQILLAIEFHLSGSKIPRELIALLGEDMVSDITEATVSKEPKSNDTATELQHTQATDHLASCAGPTQPVT